MDGARGLESPSVSSITKRQDTEGEGEISLNPKCLVLDNLLIEI